MVIDRRLSIQLGAFDKVTLSLPISSFCVLNIFLGRFMKETLDPFRVKGGKTEISHLLFAVDILLSSEVNNQTLNNVMTQILSGFFSISGQKANEDKSVLYFSPNTLNSIKDEFEQETNILSTHDLSTYLDFPLCHRKHSKNKLSFIIDKISAKLAT